MTIDVKLSQLCELIGNIKNEYLKEFECICTLDGNEYETLHFELSFSGSKLLKSHDQNIFNSRLDSSSLTSAISSLKRIEAELCNAESPELSVLQATRQRPPAKVIFDVENTLGKLKVINSSTDSKVVREISEFDKSEKGFAFLNCICQQDGCYQFDFTIELDQGASTCIGVSQSLKASKMQVAIDASSVMCMCNQLSFFQSYEGKVIRKGAVESEKIKGKSQIQPFYEKGTEVCLMISVEKQLAKVEIKINGKFQDSVIERLRVPLVPCIIFYAGMNKEVKITDSHFQGTSG
ncbi:hypothetical protein L2734_12315 [Parashewanella spongiae]|uniref:hypothetical protein n=1 Tax=Parashewanella spongiae TaxID=342950 RepID=UPI0011AE508E|nr:hypothetical protein [Parashewanella spongiae]MCL1078934.1 hypothetical protein [Parashewanella spongiae]